MLKKTFTNNLVVLICFLFYIKHLKCGALEDFFPCWLVLMCHVPWGWKVVIVHLVLKNYGCSIFTSHYNQPTKLHSSKTLEDHYTRFVQMYPKPSLIPRMHYMIHYPRTMLRYIGLDQNSSHPLYKLYISSAISYKLESWF